MQTPWLLLRLRWIFYSVLAGLLAGTAATFFLRMLETATNFRLAHHELLWALPVVGAFLGWLFEWASGDRHHGTNLVLEEIQDPRRVLPASMAPLVLLGTILSHLAGASTGREGAAVQMGASLSDQLSRFFRVGAAERKILLVAGLSGGFGAALGAPWAGMIFGMEVLQIGRIKAFAWLECLIASFVAYHTVTAWGFEHLPYPAVHVPLWTWLLAAKIALAGLFFGAAAWIFSRGTHGFEKWSARVIPAPWLRGFIGGCLLLAAFLWEGSGRFEGIGFPLLRDCFRDATAWNVPILKGLFTGLSVAAGFKGGEFVPLVIIGASLGSFLAAYFAAPVALFAATGFAAVFAGAANTPLTCTVLAMELFGPRVGPYALIACVVSYLISGHHGIYHQQIDQRKYERVKRLVQLSRDSIKRGRPEKL